MPAYAVEVSAGALFSLARLSDGRVLAWGDNRKGQADVPMDLSNVVSIAAGGDHALALLGDGTVVGWGNDNNGNLAPESDPPAGLSGVVSISAGTRYSLALLSDGSVVGWGRNDDPLNIPALPFIEKISAGTYHALAIDQNGAVHAWGTDYYGESSVPAGLPPIVQISGGAYSSLARAADGSVYEWGYVQYQNGVPSGLEPALTVDARYSHSLGISQSEALYSWGDNLDGEGDTDKHYGTPDKIATGMSHSLLINKAGEVYAWGDNQNGQTDVPAEIGPVRKIETSLSLSAELSGFIPVDGSLTSGLNISAGISGSHPEGVGAISAAIDFSPSMSGAYGFIGNVKSHVEFSASVTGFQDWAEPLNLSFLQEVYRLIITGGPDGKDDLVISGISSWQATNQADGRSSYLQAVIPAVDGLTDELEARENGELIIQKGYRFEDGSERYEEILRSEFDTYRWDRGPSRFTATVSGYLSGKRSESSKRTLTGARSISMTNGKHRARCDIDLFLQPGMTVVADDVTFQAGYINYYVNQTDKFCEVGEQ